MRIPTRRFLMFAALVGLLIGGYSHGNQASDVILDLDTLEAHFQGTTLHATKVTDAYVGPVTNEIFVAIVVDDAAGTGEARSARGYACNRGAGAWLDGEVNGNQVTLASADGVIQIKATIGTDNMFGIARLGGAEPQPFIATIATGDAGLYRAEAQVDGADRTAGWIVLEDGRQRGALLDNLGDDLPQN